MPMQRSRSSDLSESYDFDEEGKNGWSDDNLPERDVFCITPRVGFKPKPGQNPVYLSKWVLQKHNRPTCPSESQRAREVFKRYEERRIVARQLLKPSPVPSPPSPRSIIKSRIKDEFDYSSDFTEDDDDAWGRSTSRRIVTNETSSGGEEVLTSPDEEIQLLMTKRDKRVRRQTPSMSERGKQSREDGSHTGKKIKSFDKVDHQEKPYDADGRHFNLPHDRPLDPWKLPPIDNLTKKGPVNLVLNPATNPDEIARKLPTTSISDQILIKSLQSKARKLKKLERRLKKRKHHDRNEVTFKN